MKKIKNLCINLSISLVVTGLLLLFLEIGLRGYQMAGELIAGTEPHHIQTEPKHILTDLPFLYGLNPKHPQHSSQSVRDDEVIIPKPEDKLRILVLGDSVAYGSRVKSALTFPNQLEKLLHDQYPTIEVINSGVSGYTAYNELQYYLTEGRNFDADIVIIAFCMNDVANPRLHWGYTKETINNIPLAAIPNHVYDKEHVLPLMEAKRKDKEMNRQREKERSSFFKHSRLYSAIEMRVKALVKKNTPNVKADLSGIPTYITGEDTLSIEVLLDQTSSEWHWLIGIYDQLYAAVKGDQAQFIIAIFPLAYQLDDNYPYLPQNNFMDYCEQKSIPCIDLLPTFRHYHQKEDIFVQHNRDNRVNDIWHLEALGHELSAKTIMQFLQQYDLLKVKNGKSTQIVANVVETTKQ